MKLPRKWLSPFGRPAPTRAPRGSKARLVVEILEDRLVPSTSPLVPLDPAHDAWRQQRFVLNDEIAVVNSGVSHDAWRQTGVSTGALDRLFSSGDLNASLINGGTLIGLDRAFAGYPYRGNGYSVAVIDTGIDYNHAALGGGWGRRVVGGWDFVNNDADPMDDNGHGTHVAGIIGSSDATHTGVAPGVNLIALKVLDSAGGGSFGSVEDALRWVANYRYQFNIVAVNLSLGTGNYTTNPYTFLSDELTTLKGQGVFVAVASGNAYYAYNGQVGLAYPAVDPSAVSVGAVWAGDFGAVSWGSGARDYATAADRVTSFTQRSSGLDILAPGALITSTYLGGGFQSMAGTSMASPVVAGAAALLHQALVANGHSGFANQDYILGKMQTTAASVVDGDDENDNVINTGLTFRRLDLYAALNSIQASNRAPVLSPIPNQSMRPSQGSLTVTLSASDADTQPLTYSARVVGSLTQAYQLDQQLGLSYMGSYYTNFQGYGEKWLQGADAQYFILGDGQFRRWRDSNYSYSPAGLVANLSPAYYNDPSLLWDARLPTLTLSGNQLTITPNGYVGSFTIEATVSDGVATATQSFTVTVNNAAPVLGALPDRTLSRGQTSLVVSVSASDPDGDALTYSAHVQAAGLSALAGQLDQQLGLSYMGSYYTNFQGHGEKWLNGSDAQYCVLPNGELRRWRDSTYTYGPQGLVATLDPSYYADPSLLWNAPPPPSVSVSGNQLTITTGAGYVGTFTIEVTASDGTLITSGTFAVTAGNAAPIWSALGNRTLNAGTSLTVGLTASDADGDALTYSARVQNQDRWTQAYQLDQQLGLSYPGSYYTNFQGRQEKWLNGRSGQFCILPNGELRYWHDINYTYSAAGLVATLDPSYYDDPSLLWNATPPPTLSVAGNQLTVTPAVGYTGSFVVLVTAGDGFAATTGTFSVTVTAAATPNAAPALAPIANQTMTVNQGTLSVQLSAGDADGNSLTFTARTTSATSLAAQLDGQLGLSYAGSYYLNNWGLNEKWLLGAGSMWYLLLPNGELRRWTGDGGTLSSSGLVANVGAAFYADPSLLWNATNQLPAVSYSFSGSQLTLSPGAFVGTFTVEVTVSDGTATARRTFTVHVG